MVIRAGGKKVSLIMNQPEKKVRQAASEFVSRDSNNSGKSEKDEEK